MPSIDRLVFLLVLGVSLSVKAFPVTGGSSADVEVCVCRYLLNSCTNALQVYSDHHGADVFASGDSDEVYEEDLNTRDFEEVEVLHTHAMVPATLLMPILEFFEPEPEDKDAELARRASKKPETNAPAKAPTKAPAKAPAKAPVKTPAAPAKAPVKVPAKAPA